MAFSPSLPTCPVHAAWRRSVPSLASELAALSGPINRACADSVTRFPLSHGEPRHTRNHLVSPGSSPTLLHHQRPLPPISAPQPLRSPLLLPSPAQDVLVFFHLHNAEASTPCSSCYHCGTLRLGVYLRKTFAQIPCHQLARPGMPAQGKASGGHGEMLSDRAVCFTGAEGREQQGQREGKAQCDPSEQGGKPACERKRELIADNPNAALGSSPCHLPGLHQVLSSFHLRLSLGNLTQAQASSSRGNLWLVGAKPVAKVW